MMRNIGFAAIILTLLAAPHSIEQYQLARGGDGCREGQYCTGATAGGKCHGKCIPEDLNHSLCIKAVTELQHSIISLPRTLSMPACSGGTSESQ